MKLRGFGDILGYQQSGIKDFRLADPIQHEDLFKIAEQNIKDIEHDENNFKKYNFLLKLKYLMCPCQFYEQFLDFLH